MTARPKKRPVRIVLSYAHRDRPLLDLSGLMTFLEDLVRTQKWKRLRDCLPHCSCLPWDNGCGDFTITSPPYYNLEHYGDEPEQLGIGCALVSPTGRGVR